MKTINDTKICKNCETSFEAKWDRGRRRFTEYCSRRCSGRSLDSKEYVLDKKMGFLLMPNKSANGKFMKKSISRKGSILL